MRQTFALFTLFCLGYVAAHTLPLIVPEGEVICTQPPAERVPSRTRQLETQIHDRYCTTMSHLYRQRPNVLASSLKYAGTERALRFLEERQGTMDPVAYEDAWNRLVLLNAEAKREHEVALRLNEAVLDSIKKLTVFGSSRFYVGTPSPEAPFDRVYRRGLSVDELSSVAIDLEALIAVIGEKISKAIQ